MRPFSTIYILTFLCACSSKEGDQKNNNTILDSSSTVETKNFSLDEQPIKTIIDFLKWYRDNQEIQTGLVNNANNETGDSAKYYSVNFEATEKYLSELKSTGFVSEQYLDKWREYFKKCEVDFIDHPSNDGPPEGFEFDFILLSQDFEEDLKNVEKSKVVSRSVQGDNAIVKIFFPNGNILIYNLSKRSVKWLIDDIERE